MLKAAERNKKKTVKTLEIANQAMKEVEAIEIQAVAIEARRKAENEAIEEKAREVIEVEDDSAVKAEEVITSRWREQKETTKRR